MTPEILNYSPEFSTRRVVLGRRGDLCGNGGVSCRLNSYLSLGSG